MSHRRGRSSARLNSGVRRRQTKDLVVVSRHITRHRDLQFSSATYSVQPESGCTPSAVVAFGEQHCRRTEPVLCSWPGLDRYLVKNSQCPAKASLVSRLTIRSSRVRFAASTGHGKMMARRGRKSARLSSGVSPAEPQHRQRAQQELPCPALAQGSGHNSGVMACAW